MNKTYKVLFNKATGAYEAVSELASAKGKKSMKSAVLAALAAMAVFGGNALAADPTGGEWGRTGLSGDTKYYTGKDGNGKSYNDAGYTASDNNKGEGTGVVIDGYTRTETLYVAGGDMRVADEENNLHANNNRVTMSQFSGSGQWTNFLFTGGTVLFNTTVNSVNVDRNIVTATDTQVSTGAVKGGLVEDSSMYGSPYGAQSVSVSQNKVTVSNSDVGVAQGADVNLLAASVDNVTVSENEVTVKGDSNVETIQAARIHIQQNASMKKVVMETNKVNIDGVLDGGRVYRCFI